MKLSLYTCVKNGIFLDFHVVEMLKHHLPLADEIIVNEGYSSDKTFAMISGIDPKIKVFRSEWGEVKGLDWYIRFKDAARRKCSGDWCILMDCDEFIPEWEFPRLREYLESTDESITSIKLTNFYGNYKVYHSSPDKVGWPERKMVIHRNIPEIEVWGDGSNVRYIGSKTDWSAPRTEFDCHHFGMVRKPARLRQKWSTQGKLYSNRPKWLTPPPFLFDILPHNWMDPELLDGLAPYDGPFIKAVRENPDEFVRDNFKLLNNLKSCKSV